MIDAAVEDRQGSLLVLFLDWSKAFDRIIPDALVHALRRFGLPVEMLQMVRAIYTDRRFLVRDNGVASTTHVQATGIAQGCPLSPYLFVTMMSVLVQDAATALKALGVTDKETKPYVVTRDILYTDDTLLVGSDANTLQTHVRDNS